FLRDACLPKYGRAQRCSEHRNLCADLLLQRRNPSSGYPQMTIGRWKTFGLAVFAALVGFVPINFAEAQSPSPLATASSSVGDQSSPKPTPLPSSSILLPKGEAGRGGRQSRSAVAAEDLLWKKL